MHNSDFYQPTSKGTWQGRIDGTEPDMQRWHQRIQIIDVETQKFPDLFSGQKGIALIGFACDEGVRRNKGRVGAQQGPSAFRKAASSLPVHFNDKLVLADIGDVVCAEKDMEGAQQTLASLVSLALRSGYQPLVIGGGHEVAYGHYSGIADFLDRKSSIGIINFDAHFDLRQPDKNGPSSGTGFWQIAQDCKEKHQPFYYFPIGIQLNSNTRLLFNTAAKLWVNYIPAEDLSAEKQVELTKAIEGFIANTDHIYLTICLDVFSSAFAPGVSATAYNGIMPDNVFFACFDTIFRSGKVISMDIAELNPELDIGHRTAKLVAGMAFRTVMNWAAH